MGRISLEWVAHDVGLCRRPFCLSCLSCSLGPCSKGGSSRREILEVALGGILGLNKYHGAPVSDVLITSLPVLGGIIRAYHSGLDTRVERGRSPLTILFDLRSATSEDLIGLAG